MPGSSGAAPRDDTTSTRRASMGSMGCGLNSSGSGPRPSPTSSRSQSGATRRTRPVSEQRVTDEVSFAIEVAVPVDHAFRVFTEQFDSIKPREHNLLAVDIAETVLEAKPGGAVYDRGVDGTVCVWGRVLDVEPPHRLVFAWLISPQWQIEEQEDRASEVEVRFSAIDDTHT